MVICIACTRGFHKYHDMVARPPCMCAECAQAAAEKAAAKVKEKEEAS